MNLGAQGATETGWPIAQYGTRPRFQGALRAAAMAAAVAVSYYLGSLLGFVLRVPPETTSVPWPPNAILTAALLLTPSPRRWWIYLAAAFPAHLAVQLGTGWPRPMILALYVTNCSEAVLAAGCMHLLDRKPGRFETLRGMAVFLVAAVLMAPFLSSFPDAWIVSWQRGEQFWMVWRNRFFANTLTELVCVPAIVMLLEGGALPLRRARAARFGEAILFAATTIAVAILVFADRGPGPHTLGELSKLTFVLLLAPLLWGAVRFGPAGTSFSLLAMSTVALWAAVHGRGLLSGFPPREAALTFQSVTWIVGVPLMCLAAIVRERESGERHLRDRLRFEQFLSEFARAFVHPSSQEMVVAFDSWLALLGKRLRMDRMIVLIHGPEGVLDVHHAWASAAIESRTMGSSRIPTVIPRIAERILAIETEGQGAAILGVAHSWVEVPDVGWVLTVPLIGAGRVLGAFVSVRGHAVDADQSEELTRRLDLVGDVLAGAVARKDTEDALRGSEEMKSAILSSLPIGVAVLDGEGTVVAVNESWRLSANAEGVGIVGEGANYLDQWRDLAARGVEEAAEIARGIEAVIEGSQASFTGEFPRLAGGSVRWFALSVVPWTGPTRGAVVSQTDVTVRRTAELEAQSSRHDLAHLLRVSTVGVMATSLAHELNQPLTSILANAQAAQRLAYDKPEDLVELREILTDVIDQDKRAGEVIGRLRDMLRKGEIRRQPLDLNVVAQDVARLLASDALIRNVALRLDVDAQAPRVLGDPTQIRQVVLNLLLNAMDAAAESGRARTVKVAVRLAGRTGVEVAVSDGGCGIPAGLEEKLFEPFFTTKPGGMGMGLSIARSIVAAHGGRIWAASNPDGGATLRFVLPFERS
jgi:signal transduction histidine kinase/integral membrane sensor domain MASE1